jgi:hypothetical protein
MIWLIPRKVLLLTQAPSEELVASGVVVKVLDPIVGMIPEKAEAFSLYVLVRKTGLKGRAVALYCPKSTRTTALMSAALLVLLGEMPQRALLRIEQFFPSFSFSLEEKNFLETLS